MKTARGFTLIELMIAGAMSVVVIAGVLSAGMYLQQQGMKELQLMQAQVAGRASADQLTIDLQTAGLGIGSARVNQGGTNSASAIAITTDDPYAADSSFALPTAPYAGAISDSITLMSGDPTVMLSMGCFGSGGGSCSSCRFRDAFGPEARAATDVPGTLNGQTIVFVNPALNASCVHQVTGLPGTNRFETSPGRNNNPPPAGDPCETTSAPFWCTAGAYALQLNTVSYRINWKPRVVGQPQRPRLQRDPDGPGPLPWQDLMWDVEQMTFRLGLTDFTPNINNLTFFPDTVAGRPGLDQCTAGSCPVVPGGILPVAVAPAPRADVLAADVGGDANLARRLQLERRVRVVEVSLVTRSASADRTREQPLGVRNAQGEWPAFRLDEEGFPLDGYSRRRLVFQVTPRNFRLSGEP